MCLPNNPNNAQYLCCSHRRINPNYVSFWFQIPKVDRIEGGGRQAKRFLKNAAGKIDFLVARFAVDCSCRLVSVDVWLLSKSLWILLLQ